MKRKISAGEELMTISGLKGVINDAFITNLSKNQGQGKNSKGISLDKGDPVDIALRKGARNFAAGFQALNVGISYLNTATATQQKLLNVVDKFDLLVSKAGKGAGSSRNTASIMLDFDKLEREFRAVIKDATVQGTDVLDPDDLEKVLKKAGLDGYRVKELAQAFKGLSPVTGKPADVAEGETPNEPTSLIPEAQFIQALRASASAFDTALGQEDPEDSFAAFRGVRQQFRELRKNITQNIAALEDVRSVVSKNMDLAQAVGRAMLDLSYEIRGAEKAEAVALDLRERIRRQAPQALSQADNLEQIKVAGLTLTPTTFSGEKNK